MELDDVLHRHQKVMKVSQLRSEFVFSQNTSAPETFQSFKYQYVEYVNHIIEVSNIHHFNLEAKFVALLM